LAATMGFHCCSNARSSLPSACERESEKVSKKERV